MTLKITVDSSYESIFSLPLPPVCVISTEVTYVLGGLVFAWIVEEWVWDYAITVTLLHVAMTVAGKHTKWISRVEELIGLEAWLCCGAVWLQFRDVLGIDTATVLLSVCVFFSLFHLNNTLDLLRGLYSLLALTLHVLTVMSDFPSAEHWWMALGKISLSVSIPFAELSMSPPPNPAKISLKPVARSPVTHILYPLRLFFSHTY